MARWREQLLSPAAKFDDFAVQVEPAYNELVTIGRLVPDAERAGASLQTRESRERLSRRLRGLHVRGTTTLIRLTRVSTPDPELRAIRQILVMAQTNQLTALDSALKNLDSREPELSVLSSYQTELRHALDEFQKRWNAFKDGHGLTDRSGDPTL
jgi:hypothetical protein